jgi:hypothetical protein
MKNSNSLKEQKGLKILNIDNLDIFITECNELPERFKSQYISEKNRTSPQVPIVDLLLTIQQNARHHQSLRIYKKQSAPLLRMYLFL